MPDSRIVKMLDEMSRLSADIRDEKALCVNALSIDRQECARRLDQSTRLINLIHLATIHLVRDGAANYDAHSRRAVTDDADDAARAVRHLLNDGVAAEVRGLAERALRLAGLVLGESVVKAA